MPRLTEAKDPDALTASIGGGFLFDADTERFNHASVKELLRFFQTQLEHHRTVIAVIGGGPRARRRIEEARKTLGRVSNEILDQLGIQVTQENAALIARVATQCGLSIKLHEFGSVRERGTVYVRGGTEPGHTTDYVAVQAAHEAGQTILLNVTSVAGIHPMKDGLLVTDTVIPELTWDELLSPEIAKPHTPGINTVFDTPASELAKAYGMTVVVIGGKNPEEVFANVYRFLNGEEFTGTIIHP